MSGNTLGFLLSVIQLFEEADLPVWVFGGWAEELWQITPARIHNDIDFLYPARTFEHLDRLVAQTIDFQVIQAKRFSHKRAILCQDIMMYRQRHKQVETAYQDFLRHPRVALQGTGVDHNRWEEENDS